MMSLCKNIKAPKLVHLSSGLFALLCILQGVVLCIYLIKYVDDDNNKYFHDDNYKYFATSFLFFILAASMELYLRFHKRLHARKQWFKKLGVWDIKSSLWCVWLVYNIGLTINIAVIFYGVIEGNHGKTCREDNGNISLTFKNVKMCRSRDNETFFKSGEIYDSGTNETFCWKAKTKIPGLLKTDKFFGPNILKITLCLTPVLMLLLLKSAREPKREEKEKETKERKQRTPTENETGIYYRYTTCIKRVST